MCSRLGPTTRSHDDCRIIQGPPLVQCCVTTHLLSVATYPLALALHFYLEIIGAQALIDHPRPTISRAQGS